MWAVIPHHLCPNSWWFTAWHVVKLWCITKSSITRKIFVVTCGHHDKELANTTKVKFCFHRRKQRRWMIDRIVTDFLFSESLNWETVREKSISSKMLKTMQICDISKKSHWINLVHWWPTRCNQKTLPIQSCIVSMSWFFVDGLSTCISLQHQRCQRSHLFNITQDFLFSFPGARERWKKGIYAVSKGSAELHVSLFTVTTIGLLQSVKGAHRPVKPYLKKVEFNIVECGLCLFFWGELEV